jgi:hypothetical protein
MRLTNAGRLTELGTMVVLGDIGGDGTLALGRSATVAVTGTLGAAVPPASASPLAPPPSSTRVPSWHPTAVRRRSALPMPMATGWWCSRAA